MASKVKIFNYDELAHDILPKWKAVLQDVDQSNFKINVLSTVCSVLGLKYTSAGLAAFLGAISEGQLETLLDNFIDEMEDCKDMLAYNDNYDMIKMEISYSPEENGIEYPEELKVLAIHIVNKGWILFG